MDKQTMVKVDNVGIRFNLAKERVDSLKEYFLKFSKGTLKFEEFWALDGVSLEIEKGDFYGLVGINGSGKSTLLKAVAGVFKPTRGKITVNGTIAPLIELGAGFDMDLTARENIFLNGAVLGFSKDHMLEKFDDIVDFSELHDFLDVPLKNYSSGMVARIAFAIATATKPDILIADEILAVGDYAFQEKCEKRMQELLDAGTTVIFVSHSIEQVKRMCNKATWIEKGKVIIYCDVIKRRNHSHFNSLSIIIGIKGIGVFQIFWGISPRQFRIKSAVCFKMGKECVL